MAQDQDRVGGPIAFETSRGEVPRLTPVPPPLRVVHLVTLAGSALTVAWVLVALGAQAFQAVGGADALLPQFLHISVMSAAGYLLGGASLLIYAYGSPSHSRRAAAQIGGGGIVLWGVSCLVMDHWFPVALNLTTSGPIACVILVILGLAIFMLPLRTSTGHPPFQYFAGALLLIGGVAMTGYLYRVPPLYESSTYGPIDAPTAVLSFLLGLALLCTHPTEGLMRTLLSPNIGGALLRRLLPFAIGLPILAGWLRILGQRQGWYSFDFGVAVSIGVVLAILLACLWYVAGWANRVDRVRHSTSQAYEEQQDRLALAAAAARIGYWRWMEPEKAIEIDQVSAELLGLPSDSTVTMRSLVETIRPEDRTSLEQTIHTARQDLTPFEIECQPALTTHATWISLRGFPLPHTDVSPYRFHGVVLDITERRTVREALQESQQRLNSIVQSAMDAIITVDQDQQIVLFNKAAERLFRCRAEEAVGTSLHRFIPEGFRQRHDSHIVRFQQSTVMAMEMGRPGSVKALRADGHEFPIEASISQVNVGGHSLCTVILRDITERLQGEDAIREREARFRNMADSAPVIMFITDSRGSCTYLNRQWYEFTGQTEETGLQTGWLDQVHEDDRGRLVESLRVSSGTGVRRLECRVLGSRGEFQWTLYSILSMVDEQGAASGCIGSIVDITDRKMAEQTLQRWANELERQVSERTAALSRSQERLRALTVQLTRTEHQERRRIAGELHDYLAQLLVAAHLKLAQDRRPLVTAEDRMLVKDLEQILDDALTYTRSLVAKLSPPVLYHLGLPAALQWLAEQMEEHQLVVETAFDIPSSLPKLPDDVAAILFQSVRELLFNVVKHAASPNVQIVLRMMPQELVIVVTDQGQGFDTSQTDQASTATSSFGLFSIKERMESLGGSMDVNSQVGHGTSVTLLCPLRTPKKTDTPSASSDPHNEALVRHNSPSDASIRVLLVDDHAMVRQGIRALLERHGDLEVVGEAWDGQHACELVDALHPDVIVMDANMPRLDGIEATRRIKQAHPDMVIIGLSVQTAGQVAHSMLHAGASDYLTKESVGEQLYEAIQTALQGHGDRGPGR